MSRSGRDGKPKASTIRPIACVNTKNAIFYLATQAQAENGNEIVAWVIRGRIFNTIKQVDCRAGRIHRHMLDSILHTHQHLSFHIRCESRKHFYGFLLRPNFFFLQHIPFAMPRWDGVEARQGETHIIMFSVSYASFSPPRVVRLVLIRMCWCVH